MDRVNRTFSWVNSVCWKALLAAVLLHWNLSDKTTHPALKAGFLAAKLLCRASRKAYYDRLDLMTPCDIIECCDRSVLLPGSDIYRNSRFLSKHLVWTYLLWVYNLWPVTCYSTHWKGDSLKRHFNRMRLTNKLYRVNGHYCIKISG